MERHIEHKRHSGSFWAYVLIIAGVLWLLQRSGWDINLPRFGDFFAGIGTFFGNLFHLAAGVTIPLLVILFGIVLILGRKFFAALFLVLLLMILLPHFLIIPGILMIIFFPIILIIIGIIILSNLF